MPKYNVCQYDLFVTELHIDAESAEEAEAIAEQYKQVMDDPQPGKRLPFAGKVKEIRKYELVHSEGTEIAEIKADGSYIQY